MKLKRNSMNSAMDSTTSTKSAATTAATTILNNMSSFSFPLSPASRRNHQYSIERLRVVYIDLLQHIDVAKEKDLGRCGIDDADEDFHKKSMRFSFRRKLLPHYRQGSIKIINNNNGGESTTTASTPISSSTATTTLETTTTTNESRQDEVWNGDENGSNNRELVAAFRLLAATKSPDKEGDNFGAAPFRDDASVIALSTAKAIEERVVELIRNIGEIIVHGADDQDQQSPSSSAQRSSKQQHVAVRGDPVFEYFCEKNILSLLVDIAKEVRQGNEIRCSDSLFHGVVWSPKVKGQVFQTASLLLSDTIRSTSHHSSLYYLLSQNHINHLIQCMIPLKQWTDQALVQMMPSYVELLRTVTVQLANDPYLFPFLTIDIDSARNNQDTTTATTGTDATAEAESLQTNTTLFPLFAASIEVATSNFAESDSFVYGTSLAAIVNIMQISSPPIQNFVANASVELRKLSDHLCQRLLDRFYKISSLATGPIVDGIRSNAISGQLAGLRDQLGMMRELFYSGVRGLDVRLCETLLQRVVNVLLKCLLPGTTNRPFLAAVGEIDIDVIPDSEAMAQVATIFLAQMFTNLAYKPMQRMLAVALFHPKSTTLWSTTQSTKPRSSSTNEESETYIFMPALSDIVNGEENKNDIESSNGKTIPNPYREEVFKSLGGEYGEWRVLASSCLVQSMLISENREFDSLDFLNVIPKFTDALDYKATSLENAIATYLQREHRPSRVSSRSLESIGQLSLQIIQQIVASNRLGDVATTDGGRMTNVKERLSMTVSWKAMQTCLDIFREKARNCLKEGTGISNIFLDLVEAEITRRYTAHFTAKSTTASTSEKATTTTYICSLKSRESVNDSEMLVRKCRDVSSNEVETARFFIREMLQYRALNKALDCYCLDIEEKACASATINGIAAGGSYYNNSRKTKPVELKLTDEADLSIKTIGGLKDNLLEGSDLDLTGRMTFACRSAPCSPSKGGFSQTTEKGNNKRGDFSTSTIALGFRNNNPRLMLVLDPTNMNVVKPAVGQMEDNRGTILCSISLRSAIGAAADNEWLHVAVRHGDVTSLIKNGNMALKFENAGTCLVVKQYLDRSREVLRQELLEKVSTLLNESSSGSSREAETAAAAAAAAADDDDDDENERIVDKMPTTIITDATSSVQC